MKQQSKREIILISIVVILLIVFFISTNTSAKNTNVTGNAIYDSLSSEQKQTYWECFKTNKCNELLATKKNKEYRECSLSCNKQAKTITENSWCEDSDKGDNFLEKGIVKSNIYLSGKEDSCYTFPNGKTYLFEGRCKDNKYQYLQKNCAELGSNFKCKEGTCIPQTAIFVPPIKCTSTTQSNCCGNDVFESYFESPISCKEDAFNYFKKMKRPIEYVKGDAMFAVFCISPCPYSKNIVDSYYNAYKGLFDEIVSFLNRYPPVYNSTDFSIKSYSDKYPSFSVALGDSNVNFLWQEPTTYYINPSAGSANLVEMGCPSGLCIAGDPFIYLNEESKIFKQLDYKGDIYKEPKFPFLEVHETLHPFIPYTYCPDWNHGFIMFLDNVISNDELFYEQFFPYLDKLFLQEMTIDDLSDEDIKGIKQSVLYDYQRFIGYVFWSGLYKYYNCDKQCVKGITQTWLSQINNEKMVCSGKEFTELINQNINGDITPWVKSLGLYDPNGLDNFKKRLETN